MKLIRFIFARLRIRSAKEILFRIASVLTRYEMSTESFRSILDEFAEFCRQIGFQPTFPVTASVVRRHPAQFRKMRSAGVELAVHGFRHVDYSQLPDAHIRSHYRAAVRVFRTHGLSTDGFRFPFLRKNRMALQCLSPAGFLWDSSETISWDLTKSNTIRASRWNSYLRICKTYQARSICEAPSLPRRDYGLIEIPVSIPDDDILFERLGLSTRDAGSLWRDMLRDAAVRGELLNLQLHPERFPLFKDALRSVILLARSMNGCWIASLGQIAQWWRERETFTCEWTSPKQGEYEVKFVSTDRGQPLVLDPERKHWAPCGNTPRIRSSRKPVLGVSPSSPDKLKKFLADEGVIFEITEDTKSNGMYIDRRGSFKERDKRNLSEQIQQSRFPLIRYGRWPKPFTFCFAVTGDIDGMDLWDYWSRFHDGCA